MIVVDASAVLEMLLSAPAATTVESRMFGSGETAHAPHLIDIEVAQVLRRFMRRGDIDSEQGRAALQYMVDFPLVRYPHERLLPRVWELRNNLTAYDAAYVALAEALDAPLLTRDRRLAAAPGIRARIEVI